MTASKPLIPAYWHRPLAAFVLLLVVILAAYWHSAWAMAMRRLSPLHHIMSHAPAQPSLN